VVGATGSLGGLVVGAHLGSGRQVRAFVRPGSDARRLKAGGAEVVRDDLIDPPSDAFKAIAFGASSYLSLR